MIVKECGEIGDTSIIKDFRGSHWFVVEKVANDCHIIIGVNGRSISAIYSLPSHNNSEMVADKFHELRNEEIDRRSEAKEFRDGYVDMFHSNEIDEMLEMAYRNISSRASNNCG